MISEDPESRNDIKATFLNFFILNEKRKNTTPRITVSKENTVARNIVSISAIWIGLITGTIIPLAATGSIYSY